MEKTNCCCREELLLMPVRSPRMVHAFAGRAEKTENLSCSAEFCRGPLEPEEKAENTVITLHLVQSDHSVTECFDRQYACHPATLCNSTPTPSVLRSGRPTRMACHFSPPTVANPLSPPP